MNKKWMVIIIIVLVIGVIISFGIFKFQDSNKVGGSKMQMLPIPEILLDKNPDPKISDFTIKAQKGMTNFLKDKKTPTIGYNGSYLGPVIRVTSGETVNMHVVNDLNEKTSVHWHGLIVKADQDGGPHQLILPGNVWEPVIKIDQPAATLWFHPHVIGSTATQVYYGLAGLFLIDDENSKNLNIPKDYGVNDIPLIIQDRSFNIDGSFDYNSNMMDGASGNQVLVNGAITPALKVKQIKMRFRIVNGANSSNINLNLEDESNFYQIASDGGFLEKTLIENNIFLSPGERGEIIIDFSKYKEGQEIILMSAKVKIMTFIIGGKGQDITEIPQDLVKIEKMDEASATATKRIELNGMGQMVTLNGKKFDMNRIDENVKLGETEIWEITNNDSMMMMHGMGHPFHIHGTQFQVLTRNGLAPYENEKGWKDTVYIGENETVRIIVKFRNKGLYMYHCHILEHEDAGMMGQLEVN